MILDELAARLASGGIGSVGSTIFVGSLPATPDTCVALREYGGFPPEHTMGTDFIYERPTIQIVARAGAEDYQAARTKAENCYALMAFTNLTISGVRYLRAEPLQNPFLLRRDDNNRWEIGFNVLCYKERSSS